MIRLGLVGYGNVAKGILHAAMEAEDVGDITIFTRRSPESISGIPFNIAAERLDDIYSYKNMIDVMVLCGGSKSDLPTQGPELAGHFNIVDSFDTHAEIPDYLKKVHAAAFENKKTAIISSGWDPGIFSMQRLLAQSILPNGSTYTFWGKGVSQGHSEAVRNIDGVSRGVQYTVPIESAVDAVRKGTNPKLSPGERHMRICYIVVEEGADKDRISQEIKTMPNYFSDYDTTVNFITNEEFEKDHYKMPHGGRVIHSGTTSKENNKQLIEFSLNLESNPEFTGSTMMAFARAAYRMGKEGKIGGFTPFDVPLYYLSQRSREELIRDLL